MGAAAPRSAALARCAAARRSGQTASKRLRTAATIFGPRGLRTTRSERRIGCVLDGQLHRFSQVLAGNLRHQRQRHVDSRGHSAAREEVALAHHTPRVRDGAEQRQQLAERPVTSIRCGGSSAARSLPR
jgi:hypothetical protein